MTKTRALTLSLIACFFHAGCANYASVARINRDNLTALERIEKQLSKANADRLYAAEISDSGSIALAEAEAGASQFEIERSFGLAINRCASDPRCNAIRNQRLAQIELGYWAKRGQVLQRAGDRKDLHMKVIEAVAALRKNGDEIQKYLDLNWFQRLREDVKGMDAEQLKKIGDDLQTIAKRLQGAEQ